MCDIKYNYGDVRYIRSKKSSILKSPLIRDGMDLTNLIDTVIMLMTASSHGAHS